MSTTTNNDGQNTPQQTEPQVRHHHYVDSVGESKVHVISQEYRHDTNGEKVWYWPSVAVTNGVITIGPDARYF